MTKINPLQALQARAEARALLFKHATYETIGEAIDPLLKNAYDVGLVDQLGAKAVMQIIEQAFRAEIGIANE
jgi:hypothetical protein